MIEEAPDQLGQWFARYSAEGDEVFSARLLHGSQTLEIAWTDNMLWLAHRIRSVQDCAGVEINKITGRASDLLLSQIRNGTFDPQSLSRRLARVLGGKWDVAAEHIPVSDDAWRLIMARR
ncbi:MAG: hypothetical protein KY475_24215 [Planctomycetes bacterium]|nr:hypothetical protein [Planctomycetota bacterium]